MLLQSLSVHIKKEEDGNTPLLLRFGGSSRGAGSPGLVGVDRLGGDVLFDHKIDGVKL